MTVRINKQKINLREKLTEFEDKVNFDEVVRGLGIYPSDGNVGIGTTGTNSGRLHVIGGNHYNEGITLAGRKNDGSTLTSLRFFHDDDNYAHIARGASECISISFGGNVGIGTTSPGGLLELYKGSDSTGYNHLRLSTSAGGGLQIGALSDDANPTWSINTNTNEPLVFSGATNEYMRIQSGNVGIGTTDPGSYKLYINGTARVSGGDVTSDDRVKHNEQAIVGAIETLGKITPKKYIKTTEMYETNHDFELDEDGNPIDANGEPVEHSIEAGVIAQQVLDVPELAFMVSPEGVDEDGNVTSPHGLNYNSLFTYAIAAIQEQQSIIEDLKSRIETLESK